MAASSNFGNMFSVVGASALLTFLPPRPIQVLTYYEYRRQTTPLDPAENCSTRVNAGRRLIAACEG
jgi:Mg2+-importing ATPase